MVHSVLYVLMPLKYAKTSEEARKLLYDYNFFLKIRKLFGCNWFVIGGRWSNSLYYAHFDEKKIDEFLSVCNNLKSSEEKFKIFKKYFPQAKKKDWCETNPHYYLGCENDAMIVDEILYEKIIKKYRNYKEHFLCYPKDVPFSSKERILNAFGKNEKKWNIKKKNTIGKRWLIVVDYHINEI